MVDVNGKPKFPPLRKAVETRGFDALQSASTLGAQIAFLYKNRKPTIPFIELSLLLGAVVLAFG